MANLTTESITVLNGTVESGPVENFSTAGIILTGTWTATIAFEGSLDNVNYVPLLAQRLGTNDLITETTSKGQFLINTSGIESIRDRASIFTSGTIDAVIQANAAQFLQRSLSTIAGDTDGTLIGNDQDGLKQVIKGSGSSAIAEVETRSNSSNALSVGAELSGSDTLSTYRKVNTKVRSDGLTALATDATVVVESTFGFDQQPDTFFRIINTGGAGTTWTIDIAGTSNDPTTPDRDLPSYQKIFTVQVSEVGNELSLRDRIIQELNSDPNFRNSGALLKAQNATDRAIVHIYSEVFSASGEFYERPNSGDFQVTIGGSPGDGIVVVGFDNIISRSKPVTISRDFDSPHRLGLFGITGNVNVTPKELDDLFINNATLNGDNITKDMRVNGSSIPQEFRIDSSSSTDIFIEELRFYGNGNGIKLLKFLSLSNSLANGINIEVKSDNVTTILPTIQTTSDFKNKFSFGQGSSGFSLNIEAGGDDFLSVFSFANPFLLKVQGTFSTDDFIKITINDDLSSGLNQLEFIAKGFKKEP